MNKFAVLITVVLLALSTVTAYGADEITVLVNGEKVVSDTPAVITPSGSTMLPFRSIFNALGVNDDSIKWNQNSKSIEVRSGGKYMFLMIGNTGALVNDALVTLNAAPYIENGRTFVPVRFVSESLGADVKWNKSTKTVEITSVD
jgi:hypothetical protein